MPPRRVEMPDQTKGSASMTNNAPVPMLPLGGGLQGLPYKGQREARGQAMQGTGETITTVKGFNPECG
jgi:hypothetical protein